MNSAKGLQTWSMLTYIHTYVYMLRFVDLRLNFRHTLRWSLFLLSFCVIGTFCFIKADISIFLKKTKNMLRPENMCHITPLHVPPLNGTSSQQPLSSVHKVSVLEQFNCTIYNKCISKLHYVSLLAHQTCKT